jgi:hypothetical protein
MEFKYIKGLVNGERRIKVEEMIGIRFPHSYFEMIYTRDGSTPKPNIFEYYDIDYEFNVKNCIGSFLCINPNQYGDLLSTYLNPPEFFPKGLVAFAEDGGGNLICFDYREGKDNPNPPIVYWNHEADIGKDVSFVAKDFETFIGMLKSDDEL